MRLGVGECLVCKVCDRGRREAAFLGCRARSAVARHARCRALTRSLGCPRVCIYYAHTHICEICGDVLITRGDDDDAMSPPNARRCDTTNLMAHKTHIYTFHLVLRGSYGVAQPIRDEDTHTHVSFCVCVHVNMLDSAVFGAQFLGQYFLQIARAKIAIPRVCVFRAMLLLDATPRIVVGNSHGGKRAVVFFCCCW